jgi:2-dehydro-3-deoxygluconokinase
MSVVVGLGEVMLRITPAPQQRWLQSSIAGLSVGGAEANVLVALAQFGHHVRLVSALPDHALGEAVLRALRGAGIDSAEIQRRPGRIGTYYLDPGALMRAPEVIYDRLGSVFSELDVPSVDLDRALANAQHFHVSGITPGLGANSLALTRAAMRAARERGLSVSFDCNYRQALWQRWGADAPNALRGLMESCDGLFADARDLALCFALDLPEAGFEDRLAWTQATAFQQLPDLRWIAQTTRSIKQVDRHSLASAFATRDGDRALTPATELIGIVDRIGTGDAFAAGVLHGILNHSNAAETVAFAHAAGVLKHSIHGDFLLGSSVAEVAQLAAGSGLHVRR